MSEKLNNVLSPERIDNARKRIAKCLNMLETTAQEVRWACKSEKWNDEVVYQIEEAATKLGYALATLYRWNDDPEKDEVDE
jgi:hypothetical protein